jgi:hypothetical protein
MVSLKNRVAYIPDPTELVALAMRLESAEVCCGALAFTQNMHHLTNTQARAIVTTLSSDGLRIITLFRAPGRQMAGAAAGRHSVTDPHAAGGVVWRRRLPRTAKPPRYGNKAPT